MILLLIGCFQLTDTDKQSWLDLYGNTVDSVDTATTDTEEPDDTADTDDTEEPLEEPVPEPFSVTIGGNSFQSNPIPAGSFDMGCVNGDDQCDDDESPNHVVTISEDFYVMESEITQGLYEAVMGNNPSHFSSCGSACPVETVQWLDAVTFANTLSTEQGLDACYQIDGDDVQWTNQECNGWRLPTEAEWEYAARGGVAGELYAGSDNLENVGWFIDNSEETTHAVCEKQRNNFGLCDMSGNVWEWSWDWYDSNYYTPDEAVDPLGADDTSTARVRRGGAWNNEAQYPRVSNRMWSSPTTYTANIVGFRLAISSNPMSPELVDAGENSFWIKLLPAGSFNMGCTSGDEECDDDENPAHVVTISEDFYVMKSEVTQGLYEAVMGNNPSRFSDCGSACPVEKVSWFDAVTFANTLSTEQGLDACYQIDGDDVQWTNQECNGWRLPTEAEWEYAARGNVWDKTYAGSDNLEDVGWFVDNSEETTHAVCEKQRNDFGLCDMSGNVWEWNWDWYNPEEYSNESQTDPLGPSTGSNRVKRGGAWDKTSWRLRISVRASEIPDYAVNGDVGFRLVKSL